MRTTTDTLIPRLTKLNSMDPIRIERLAWATVFAAVVALVVAFALLPDGLGVPRPAVAAVVFVVVGGLAARLARNTASPSAKLGDQTIQYVVFFLVAAGGQVGLAALGYEGIGPRMAAFAAGWLVAVRAKRLNPRRRREQPVRTSRRWGEPDEPGSLELPPVRGDRRRG